MISVLVRDEDRDILTRELAWLHHPRAESPGLSRHGGVVAVVEDHQPRGRFDRDPAVEKVPDQGFARAERLLEKRTRVSHAILEKLQTSEKYGPLLLNTVIRINTTIAESAAAGMPVIYFRPGSTGAVDFTRLSEEVAGRS